MDNPFVWADLSTFNLDSAKSFYRQCFDWNFQSVDDGYLSCQSGNHPTAGIYTMPSRFQNIKVPSFWMSYIYVDDLEQTVRLAEQWGGKVEVKPEPAPGGGKVALIRDPAGAGFTCYHGDGFTPREESPPLGCMAWNELFVSDLSLVEAFYTQVFDWHITAASEDNRYEIYADSKATTPIAGIQVASNDIKGDKEFWAVYFSVADLNTTAEIIELGGGDVLPQTKIKGCETRLAYD